MTDARATLEQLGDGDGVALLRLQAPRANALSKETIVAFSRALYEVERSDARALVLTGHPTVFCAGLDLVAAGALDRSAFADFVDAFEALFLQLFALRLPVVAAIAGPAVAGGAVLACACDVRVASASGNFRFGLNEVALGLPFPSAALEVAKFALPKPAWTRALVQGELFDRSTALALGLIDAVADDAVAEATTRARLFAALGPEAVQKTKLDLRHDALTHARARSVESRRIFVERWFSPDSERRRADAIAAFKKR
jgi:enoyl-CoA hydratase